MKRREIREQARQAVHSLLQVHYDTFPETDLSAGIDLDDMDDDDILVLHDEFDRILNRIWPR